MATIFETDRLLVREFTEDDVDAAWRIYGDPEVSRWLGGSLVHDSVEQTRDLLRRVSSWERTDGLGLWAVVEKATGDLIGGAELLNASMGGQEQVEVGYHFRRDTWGKGYATELAAAILRHGFEVARLECIVGVHLTGNEASARVLRKIGMREQGMVDYNGTPVHYFTLDRREWTRLHDSLQ